MNRLLFGIVFAGVVYWTPYFKDADDVYPSHYYLLLMLVYVVHQVNARNFPLSYDRLRSCLNDASMYTLLCVLFIYLSMFA